MKSPQALKPGSSLGPYQVIRLLGSGGMGEVYEAVETPIDRRVALKVIHSKGMESEELVQRFLGEGKALAKLNHSNVVQLYAFGQIGQQYYMAMEFIEGIGLDEFIKKVPYGIEETLQIFRQLLDGMQMAHAAGIVHRDLKPQNIIIGKSLTVKVIDFGIAKVIGDQDGYKTATGMFIGTLNYLAPEIARGQAPSNQTDIYGMGVILFEMLTGRVPFRGKNTFDTLDQIRNKAVEFPKQVDLLLPESVKRLVFKMMAKKLSDRYSSVAHVIEDLSAIKLTELPSELKAKSVHTHQVKNLNEIQRLLKSRRFEDPEIKMIINLACEIQSELSFDPNKTLALGENAALTVSDRAIDEAIERFSFIRSDLSQRRTEATQTHISMRSKAKPREASRWLTVGAGLMFIFGAVFFWKMRLQPTPISQTTLGSEKPKAKNLNEAQLVSERAGTPTQGVPQDLGLDAKGFDAQKKTLFAPLPRYSLGEKFRFSVKTKLANSDSAIEQIINWTVTQEMGEDSAWTSDIGTYRVNKRNLFVGPLRQLNTLDGQDFTEIKVGDTRAPFPLELGKRATYEIQGKSIDESQKWSYRRSCEVINYERQSLTFGTYWTYKVRCKHDNDDEFFEEFYYSPTLRLSTRVVTRFMKEKRLYERVTELLEVSAPSAK